MEKLSKKDLREKLFEFKENPIKAKEYIEDLICVNKGYLYYGSINLDETFFIHNKDFKEQLNGDISEMRRISKENPLMEKDENLYYEKNKDIEYSKVQIGATFYKDLKNESFQIINNLEDSISYKMRVNNTLVSKIDKINNSLENIEGSFLLEYTPYLSSLYLTKKDENDEFKTKTYNFMGNELEKEEPSYKEFYARKKYEENHKTAYKELNNFLNSGSKSKEDFLNLESGFNSFTDENIIDKKNRFSKVELHIVPDLQEKNYIKIVKDDEELTVNGKDVNLGELITLDNSGMFLFYKEQDKVKEHEKTLDEMTYEVRKIKRELEKEDFQSLKENVYSLVLNDDNIREITGNFKNKNFIENKNLVENKVKEIYEDIFNGLGNDFTNNFLVNNAQNLGLTVNDDKKIKEFLEENPENYKETMNEYVKNIYMVNVQEFGAKATAFSLNPNSTDITDEFSEKEILGKLKTNNYVKKLEKVYDDLYKFGKREVEKGKEFLNNSVAYSRLAKMVNLEVDMFSTKFYDLEIKNELKEEKELSYKTKEKDIEKEKTKENSKDDFDFGIE
jgi:hypothetical protein